MKLVARHKYTSEFLEAQLKFEKWKEARERELSDYEHWCIKGLIKAGAFTGKVPPEIQEDGGIELDEGDFAIAVDYLEKLRALKSRTTTQADRSSGGWFKGTTLAERLAVETLKIWSGWDDDYIPDFDATCWRVPSYRALEQVYTVVLKQLGFDPLDPSDAMFRGIRVDVLSDGRRKECGSDKAGHMGLQDALRILKEEQALGTVQLSIGKEGGFNIRIRLYGSVRWTFAAILQDKEDSFPGFKFLHSATNEEMHTIVAGVNCMGGLIDIGSRIGVIKHFVALLIQWGVPSAFEFAGFLISLSRALFFPSRQPAIEPVTKPRAKEQLENGGER